ncbi:PAS domain S-box-containing protein [Pedobacter sp. CG_S7]|uniref:helix-turn-helix domain-containing protein n=1 Tax=Pedobacter sp. CG_S7 TaxID=3143930 RepID=UPI003396A4B5
MNAPGLNDLFDLEYFFELSPDLLCVAGYDGYFKKINSAVIETLGYTKEELFSRPISSFIHIDDRDETSRTRNLMLKDNPLINFENRYITKSGEVVWLIWTSILIKREQVVFAIAKNITYKKKLEEYRRISNILSNSAKGRAQAQQVDDTLTDSEYSPADQLWLSDIETIVRKYTGKIELNINMLSNEMAISERQLFRRIKSIMGVTPNQYIRVIRLQLAMEAIETGKYRTVTEIAHATGFKTPAYFSKIFKEIYSLNVGELL